LPKSPAKKGLDSQERHVHLIQKMTLFMPSKTGQSKRAKKQSLFCGTWDPGVDLVSF